MTYREYVEQVRTANELAEVVRDYKVGLENNMAICPFHPDTRPSLSINRARQLFHCFGCHAGGDVFHWVQRMEGCAFPDAVTKLAQRAGLATYRPPQGETDPMEVERQILDLTDWLARYAHNCLTAEAREYVTASRGLPQAFIDRFLFGWADGSGVAAVQQHLGPAWLPIMEAAGLATHGRDLLFERVIFPVLRNERAMFLTGRTIEPGREPKYLHQKGREAPLYNEDAINAKEVFVTEGAVDALSLVAWDYPAVALQGGMRPGALRRLQRPARVYACFDADRAGTESTLRLAIGLGVDKVRVVALPAGLDPNDVYRTGDRAAFATQVAEAVNPVRFFVQAAVVESRTKSLAESATLLGPALRVLSSLAPIMTEAYLDQEVEPMVPKGWLPAVRQQIKHYRADTSVQCPACGTVLQHG